MELQSSDLKSLKQTLQMDILRCKTPELVRKELWTHILAYNLIRTIAAQAAIKHGIEPRTISFKGTLQTLEAFQPVIASSRASTTLPFAISSTIVCWMQSPNTESPIGPTDLNLG